MYIEKAKERYDVLLKLRPVLEDEPEGCTLEQIQSLSEKINLYLPKAYVDFLLWTGRSGGCFASDEFHIGRVGNINIENCRELLRRYHLEEGFPDDAIFIIFYHGGYMFDFIRSSEGDNPPVHHVTEVETEAGLEIQWNYSNTIEEHCLREIEHFIEIYQKIKDRG